MGIPKLNKLLLEKCENTELIKKINLHELSGKTIAIDTSIYLYKFSAQERLIENFYLLIALFLKVFNRLSRNSRNLYCMQFRSLLHS